jgi:hypothetical protein
MLDPCRRSHIVLADEVSAAGRIPGVLVTPEPLPGTDIGMSASSNWGYRSVVAGA